MNLGVWKSLSRAAKTLAFVSILCALPGVAYGYGGGIGPEEYTGAGSARQATDYKNPLRDPTRPNTYHVTICDDGNWYGAWYPPEWKGNSGGVKGNGSVKGQHGYAKQEDGTGGGVQIMGNSPGTTEVTLTKEGGITLHLRIRVIHCDNSNQGHRGITENATAVPTENTLETLIRDRQLGIDTSGTGETIGHIADLKLTNLTDQPINCVIPPMVLESKSQANQDYVCPKTQTAKIDPHGTATVPMNGVCINRGKPPVGKGVPGDLVVNTGDPSVPQNPDSHIPAKQARDLLRICTSKYEAADKLQTDGALKDLPYKDKQKQKDIVVQWSTWSDPRICEITGAPPATKDDLKKVVYKQVEAKGRMSPETKKKIDQGVDTIFEKIELTTAKAKDLEEPETYAQTKMTGGTFENSDTQGESTESPPPTTQEKPKKEKKKKKWPKPIQDWLDKKDAADKIKKDGQDAYNAEKKKFFDKSKHHAELEKARDDAKKKAEAPGATQQDKDNYKEALKELEKNETELQKEFNQTSQGKLAVNDLHKSEREAQKAEDAAKDAEKKLPPGIDKDEIQKQHDAEKKPVPAQP